MKKVIAGLMLIVSVVSVSFALNQPVITKAENCEAFVDLRWGIVGGADEYTIYRSTYSGGLEVEEVCPNTLINVGNPERVKASVVSVSTGSVSLTWDSVLTDAVTYYFRVQAMKTGQAPSAVSDEVAVYIPDRAIAGYVIWRGDWWTAPSQYASVDPNVFNYTQDGLGRRQTFLVKISAISSYYVSHPATFMSPLSPANYISTNTVGCILSDPASVSLTVDEDIVTVSFDGYNGYGGIGYYKLAHSVNPVITETDFDNGVTGTITSLVNNGCKITSTYTEGATNYYAIKVVDFYKEMQGDPPDLIMVSDTISRYAMTTQVDHYEISTASSIIAGDSFPVSIIAKNIEGVILNSSIGDSASLTSVMADNEAVLSSNDLIVTDAKTISGDTTVFHRAYRKAEDIKVKMVYNGKTAISNTIAVEAGALADIDASANPGSIISGQTADITTWLLDLYGNRIKSVKVQFQVNKGKGRVEKGEDTTDVTGRVKIKFFHDDVTPGINMIKVTAEHLTADVQVNVAVLVYGKQGGTVVASEDPNTQVVIPPDAVSGDVQLSIKTGEELTDAEKLKVNNANVKAEDTVCEDKVRNFTITNADGSEYGNFSDLVSIEIPYVDDNNDDIVDGTNIKVADLKVCRLNETTDTWEIVSDGGDNIIDRTRKCVIAQVAHFSTYNIGAPLASRVSALRVYPNPINFSKAVRNTLKFDYVAQNSSIKIYDITGRLVQAIDSLNSNIVEWDGKNESGDSVSMGLYIYLLTDSDGNKKTGKIGVQK